MTTCDSACNHALGGGRTKAAMIRESVATFACFVVLADVAVSAEPFALKDDPLGMSLPEFKQKYHREVAGSSRAPFCSDDSPKGSGIEVAVPFIGLTNCRQEFPFEAYRSGPRTTIAGVPAEITYSFLTEDTVKFENDRLWSIRATFEQSTYTTVRTAFIDKYGSPNRKETRAMQNAMGASFEREVLTWENPVSYIQLLEYGGDFRTSEVLYRLKNLEQEFAQRKRAQDKSRSGDL